MNIDLSDPTRYQFMSSKEENEIREIFHQHWEKMKNQVKAVLNGISVWRNAQKEI